MARTNIHMPIAVQKETEQLVHASEVPNGGDCDCYCSKCKGDLIAVNKEIVQVAHFRHKEDSQCPFRYDNESYIHWLAKEAFQFVTKLKIPTIGLNELCLNRPSYEKLIANLKGFLRDEKILEDINPNALSLASVIFQKPISISIDGIAVERSYDTSYGRIQVDVVLKVGDSTLFVEPFLTNKITPEKQRGIAELDISTLSINLIPFLDKFKNNFYLQDLIEYLQNWLESKEWKYLSFEKITKLMDKAFGETFQNNLKTLKESILKNKTADEKIRTHYEEITALNLQLFNLNNKIDALEKEKIDINNLFVS